MLPPSAELLETPCDAPSEVAALQGSHDVIVIDNHGLFRRQCAAAAPDHLADGGFIILDNSDQCLRACEVLREKGLVQIDFTGFAPSNGYAQTTSVFFRNSIRFRPLNMIQPARSPAQPNLPWQNC
jgi:hypothetical protein